MGNEGKNGKVPLISKIAYGFGDVGCNFSWIDLCFVSENKIILQTIAHEGMCFGLAELFRDI